MQVIIKLFGTLDCEGVQNLKLNLVTRILLGIMVVGVTSNHANINPKTLAEIGRTSLCPHTLKYILLVGFSGSLRSQTHPNVKRKILGNKVNLLQGGFDLAVPIIITVDDSTLATSTGINLVLVSFNLLPILEFV